MSRSIPPLAVGSASTVLTALAFSLIAVPFAVAQSPAHPRHGGSGGYWEFIKRHCPKPDAGELVRRGARFSNLFGYAFPPSARRAPTEAQLLELAAAMDEAHPGNVGQSVHDPRVPAGMAFFGQFVDHDITFDTVSRLAEASDPATIKNLRTPRLDLDSLYANGPEGSPYLYDRGRHGHFLIGTTENPLDLPRNAQGVALIGDPRNDENSIIAQLHLLFLRFHNAVLSEVESGALDALRPSGSRSDFEFARDIVRKHYQWIVVHEFLPAIVQGPVLDAVLRDAEKGDGFCQGTNLPALPIEFSAAAYRFGHSQIRGELRTQRRGAELSLFFDRSVPGADPALALTSFGPIPVAHTVDWSLFFRTGIARPLPSRRIDTLLTRPLFHLPFADGREAILPFRNLVRGSLTFDLATGEEVRDILAAHGIRGRPLPTHPAIEGKFDGTPLWFYVLHEAAEGGGKLGVVGGTLVASTLLRMIDQAPSRYTSKLVAETRQVREAGTHRSGRAVPAVDGSGWRPFLVSDSEFSMRDLVRYVHAAEGR